MMLQCVQKDANAENKISDDMEPHQETKIMEMVYYVINEYGVSAGFPELIKGFKEIIEIKEFLIGMYLRIMFNSYSEEDILQFANLLVSCPRILKLKLKNLYLKV